jgi:hypothetical protein
MKTLLFAFLAFIGITAAAPQAQAHDDCYRRSHRHHHHTYYSHYPRYYSSDRYYYRPSRVYYSNYYPSYYPRTCYRRPGLSVSFGF